MMDRTPGRSCVASLRTPARWSVRYRISPASPRSTQFRNRAKSGEGPGAVTPTSPNPHSAASSCTTRLFTDFAIIQRHVRETDLQPRQLLARKMGKTTIAQGDYLFAGLNCF